jgi:hypothetical protein
MPVDTPPVRPKKPCAMAVVIERDGVVSMSMVHFYNLSLPGPQGRAEPFFRQQTGVPRTLRAGG